MKTTTISKIFNFIGSFFKALGEIPEDIIQWFERHEAIKVTCMIVTVLLMVIIPIVYFSTRIPITRNDCLSAINEFLQIEDRYSPPPKLIESCAKLGYTID